MTDICIACTGFDICYRVETLCDLLKGDYKYYKEDPVMIQMKQEWNNGHWDDSGDMNMRKFTPEELIEYKVALKQVYKPTGKKFGFKLVIDGRIKNAKRFNI